MKAFISYAREDIEIAKKLYYDLKQRGIEAWLDVYDLLPGLKWKMAIKSVIQESNFFLTLLSKNSVNKRGFVQKELNFALDILDEIPDNDIFLIPIRIDNCDISHDKLTSLNWVNLSDSYEDGFNKIIQAINFERKHSQNQQTDKLIIKSQSFYKSDNEVAINQYLSYIKKLSSTIRIYGTTKPVPFDRIYININIKTNKSHQTRKNIKNGTSVTDDHKKLLIMGKPGSGKTTFLKHISLHAISKNKFPIFVNLKMLADSNLSLMDFILMQFDDFLKSFSFVLEILQMEKTIILLDGLDEVNQANMKRSNIIDDIISFVGKYHNCQYIITCRSASTDYIFEKFTYVEITDFDDNQIQLFSKQWFIKNKKKQEQFYAELSEYDRLKELARTPLLLSLLCLIFDEGGTFPSTQNEIYKKAVNIILKMWDRSKNIKRDKPHNKLSIKKEQKLVSYIAYNTFIKNEYSFSLSTAGKIIFSFWKDEIEDLEDFDDIEEDDILKAIEAKSGIIREQSSGTYSFSHISFHEYFTAQYIFKHQNILQQIILDYIYDDTWREVFLRIAEALDDTCNFIEIFITKLEQTVISEKRLKQLLSEIYAEVPKISTENSPFEKRLGLFTLIIDTAMMLRDKKNVFSSINILSQEKTISNARDIVGKHLLVVCNVISRVHALAKALSDPLRSWTVRSYLSRGEPIYVSFGAYSNIKMNTLRDIMYSEYANAIKWCEELGLIDIQNELINAMNLFKKDNVDFFGDKYYVIYELLAKQMKEILEKKFPIETFNFTNEQAYPIASYFKAVHLLMDCMEYSPFKDKEKVLERLFNTP